MDDETRTRIEENKTVIREETQKLIESDNVELMLDSIQFYAEMIELMARALVNKNKQ